MADYTFYLPAIDKGYSPYYSILTPVLAGTDTISIYGGQFMGIPNIWEVLMAGSDVNTDATVADRYAVVSIVGPAGVSGSLAYVKSPAIPASQSEINTYINSYGVFGGSATTAIEYYVGMSQRVPLVGPEGRIYMNLATGKAGDTMQGKIVLKYLNHELGMYTYQEITGQKPICNQGGC